MNQIHSSSFSIKFSVKSVTGNLSLNWRPSRHFNVMKTGNIRRMYVTHSSGFTCIKFIIGAVVYKLWIKLIILALVYSYQYHRVVKGAWCYTKLSLYWRPSRHFNVMKTGNIRRMYVIQSNGFTCTKFILSAVFYKLWIKSILLAL